MNLSDKELLKLLTVQLSPNNFNFTFIYQKADSNKKQTKRSIDMYNVLRLWLCYQRAVKTIFGLTAKSHRELNVTCSVNYSQIVSNKPNVVVIDVTQNSSFLL